MDVGGSWGPLAPGSGNNANAFGPEVTFGRTLADENPDRNIAIVKYAVGGTDMPFVIGQLAFSVVSATRTENWPVVQNAQARNAAGDDDAYLVITTDLPLQGDDIHLTSSAQHDFGIRCAEAVQGQIDPLQITNPGFESSDRVDGAISSAIVSGWIKSGGSIGTYNPDDGFYSDPSVLDTSGGTLRKPLCGLLGAEALPVLGAALWRRRRRLPGSH